MTVQKFIDILQKEVKEVDREIAEIEIWSEAKDEILGMLWDIDSMSGFGLSPDILIRIKQIDDPPLCKPATFKAEHKEMIEGKIKEIEDYTEDQL